QVWPFCLDHDHLGTYGQQGMRYRAIGPRPTIEYDGFEGPHTEVNLRSRIATDETGDDDGRVFGKVAGVAGHGSSAFFWSEASCTELANVDTAIILAIDLGKFKSVACVYRRGGGGTPAFHTVASTRAALLGLLDAVGPAVVVIEACALAGWAHDLCVERGLSCKVANTAAEAWRFKNLKRKTDRDDALRLAQLEALGPLPTLAPPPPAV